MPRPSEQGSPDPARQRRPRPTMHGFARVERRFHAWRERRARRRGLTPSVVPFPTYGGEGWIRVLGRVLIVPGSKHFSDGSTPQNLRGWRAFLGIPIAHCPVVVTVNGVKHDLISDRGGVIDATIATDLPPGKRTYELTVDDRSPVIGDVTIVGSDVDFGIVSDVDDTVMVTALPRPFLAAWNSFVVHTHARQAVPGMSVLLERLTRQYPGAPVVYLSTGAWNVAPTLRRFLARHLYPPGSLLLTDWGPTHDHWFRNGQEHKRKNLERLAAEFPNIRWLLVGDDGQHDDEIYTDFTKRHPSQVAAVAIRRLTPAEAILAGGRTVVDDHSAAGVPWVSDDDGAGLAARLRDVGILEAPAR